MYSGQVLTIPCSRGGLNTSPAAESIPEMMVNARNLNLHNGGREKRGGTVLLTDSPVSTKISGLYDFTTPTQANIVYYCSTAGSIYKDAVNTIATGLSNEKGWFETFDKELYFCNSYDIPLKWTGSGNMSALTQVPTDWSTTGNKPQYMINHGRGNSQRMWAFGCPLTPYTIYISPNNDGDDFSNINVTTLRIDTGDTFGLVGGIVYLDQLLVFGRKKTFIIDDADTSPTNWGYFEAPWNMGAAHGRLVIKTPNDIVIMTEDGEIYSISAAQKYGDYQSASLTRPAFIHKWIKDNVAMAYINDFHAIYDPQIRAIKFFVVRTGQTQVDTALVYFIDRPPEEAWTIHDNTSYNSGYTASCSALVRVSAGLYRVFTGDYSGNIWTLENSNTNDNNNSFYASMYTHPLKLDNPELNKIFRRMYISVIPQASEVLTINWWVDGSAQTAKTITISGAQREYKVELNKVGKRLQFEIANSVINTKFFIKDVSLFYKQLGELKK